MAKVILICGKICSGKSYYAQWVQRENNAVILSCDEIESAIFHHSLGERYDEIADDIKKYLHKKTTEIVSTGSSVILDWGFWGKAE